VKCGLSYYSKYVHRLRVIEGRVLRRRIFGLQWKDVTGGLEETA
jgi:hypothetical protein